MTDRAQALHALRSPRSAGLPTPPPRPALVLPDLGDAGGSPGSDPGAAGDGQPAAGPAPAPTAAHEPEAAAELGSDQGPRFTFDGLVARPVQTCKAMTDVRAAQPAKALNIDVTPSTADSFDERCRALRVKKKDVVEVLLRAWLAAAPASDKTA